MPPCLYPKGISTLILFFLLSASTAFLSAVERTGGYTYYENYGYKDYEHQPQNWGMVQAKNGIIYVANQGGVLEYDGVSWRVINVANHVVRSLAIDGAGTVFVGGKNEIGFLAPDAKGVLKYKSLARHFKEKHKSFGNVWNTHAVGTGVFFRTNYYLFKWDGKEMKVLDSREGFRSSFVIRGKLVVQEKGSGIKRFVDGELKLMPGGGTFSRKKIYFMIPFAGEGHEDALLVGTRTLGFYLYDGEKAEPFPTGVEDILKENGLSHGVRLSSGDVALATLRGGLVIIDSKRKKITSLGKADGLQGENIKHLFLDRQDNLWLCLNKGISKIEYSSPISFRDERSGLSGTVLSVVRHGDELYAGTTSGVYLLKSSSRFRRIESISGSCWDLVSIGNTVLAATSRGVFDVKSGRRLTQAPAYVLKNSRSRPGTCWCGTARGLAVLAFNGSRWNEADPVEKTRNYQVRSIVETPEGHLWLGALGRVLKVEVPASGHFSEVFVYKSSDGCPGGQIYTAWAAGHVVFATEDGIFQFNERERKIIPDRLLGDEYAGAGKAIFRLVENERKHVLFHSKSRTFLAFPGPGGKFVIDNKPFARLPMVQVNGIYPDPDGTSVWLASIDGLVHYDASKPKNYDQGYRTLIRRIFVKGELFYSGWNGKLKAGETVPAFTYGNREFRFEFAAPYFEAEAETLYQCLLEGYDKDWTAWSKETWWNYTNLDAGRYVFRVRARNVYGKLGAEDVFRFEISPPWYLTWWAVLLFLVLLVSGMYLVVFLRSRKLQREKKTLENVVEERTREVHEKNRQLEQQTLELTQQSAKLEELDEMKSRFFANISHEFRTPLTLIMGPMEQMAAESSDKKQKENLSLMQRNTRRLLRLINQLLDLSRLDCGKNKLRAARQDIIPFLKGIIASFQGLARELRLFLDFQSGQDSIFLYFDAAKMEDVIANLLINAVKFTPRGGKIAVSVFIGGEGESGAGGTGSVFADSVPPDRIGISVRDTGIGISQEQLPHIFDRFFQVRRGEEGAGEHGAGIGLALAKENVLLHRGKINVHSGKEKGAEFIIILPIGREHFSGNEIADSPAEPVEPGGNGKLRSFVPEDLLSVGVDEGEGEGEIETGSGPDTGCHVPGEANGGPEKDVILVVEDNAEMRAYISKPLEHYYTVAEAVDGEEGIKKAREIIPDLIVSDIMMPGVDGYRLCRELKRDVGTSHIPIILLTAKASEDSHVRGLGTGADDYMTKPFSTRILLSRIGNLIELRRQMQLRIQRRNQLLPTEISVSSADDKFLKEFNSIIEKNFGDEDFDVEMICKKLQLSRATVFRKIKALTGEPPNQHILSYRLERGAQLLRKDFGNITDVAMAVGFSSPAYFSRCFKEKFQQSPREFQAAESER